MNAEYLKTVEEEFVRGEDKIHLSFFWAEVLDNANFATKINN